jgi:hypothetical protein
MAALKMSCKVVALVLAAQEVMQVEGTIGWVLQEEFKATGCAAANLVNAEYLPDDCKKEDEHKSAWYGVYVAGSHYKKQSCVGTNYVTKYYSDSACTTVIARTPVYNMTLTTTTMPQACTAHGSSWKKFTCAATVAQMITQKVWMQAGCAGPQNQTRPIELGMCRAYTTQKANNAGWNTTQYKKGLIGSDNEVQEQLFATSACTGTALKTTIMKGYKTLCSPHYASDGTTIQAYLSYDMGDTSSVQGAVGLAGATAAGSGMANYAQQTKVGFVAALVALLAAKVN